MARPPYQRSPDEAVYEFSPQRPPGRRCRAVRVQHRHRLSHRGGPTTAVAEKAAEGRSPARPTCRGLGPRDRADAGGRTWSAGGRRFRGDPLSPSRDQPGYPAHAGTADTDLAGAERPRPGRDLPPEPRTGPPRAVGLHRHGGIRRDDRRRTARASPLSLPLGLFRFRAWPCHPRRRKLRGPGRGTAECTVGARRRSRAASQ